MDGWQGKYLSVWAKLIIIKSVLLALPIYLISILNPPVTAIMELQRMMANFFWNNSNGGNRCHWVKWENFCLPTEKGDLGVRLERCG